MARLFDVYKKDIISEMMSRCGYSNILQVPRLEKIVLNMGLGKASANKKILEEAVKVLACVSGQKPVITKARKSVAGFKLKEGDKIGCKVTLRKKKMYEFLDRLISIVLPRFKDFRGLSPKSFDMQGNYSLGVTEQSVFTEVNHDEIETQLGMDITLNISNGSKKDSFELLKLFGMPFKLPAGEKN
ncbi:MAG: 50S ribosomal protein L5 [Candidatus Anammoxibacter sp.]